MRRQTLTAAVLLALAAATAAAAADPDTLVLARDGNTEYCVVIAAAAAPQIRAVAADFAQLFQRMTGAAIPVVPDSAPLTETEIIIGPSAHLDALAMYIDWDALGAEGYVIRTQGARLALFGGPRGGTRNAVYTFLDEHLGCRFYSPELTVVPEKRELVVGSTHVEKVPTFEARNVNVAQAGDPFWAARTRLNCLLADAPHWMPEAQKNAWSWNEYATHPLLAGAWFFAGRPEYVPGLYVEVHTLHANMLLSPELAETHPDFFAFRSGVHGDKRHPDNGICPTAPGLVEVVAERAKDWIRKAPNPRVISISMADRYYACGCERCKTALRQVTASYSQPVDSAGNPVRPSRNQWTAGNVREAALFLDFVRRVATEIHQEFPDIYVHTLAYYWTRYPPDEFEPFPGLIVDYEFLCECRYHSLAQCRHNEEIYGFWTTLRRWTKLCPRVWVWDSCYGFSVKPSPVLENRGLFYQELALAGVAGVRVHMCGSTNQWLGELRAYIYAKLLWNPDYDVAAGIEEYCRHAYGAAAAPMHEYVCETQDSANYFSHDWKKGGYTPVPGFHELGSSQVRPEALARWTMLLAAAETAAANAPAALARIRTQLKWHHAYLAQCEQAP